MTLVILTASEIRSYCLGLAQIIPVLLIAAFVLEAPRLTRVEKENLARTFANTNRQRRERDRRMQSRSERTVSEMPLPETTVPPEVAGPPDESTKQALRNIQDSLKELRSRTAELDEARESLEYQKALLDIKQNARREEKGLYIYITIAIILGIAAELTVIWGGLGLVNSKVALAIGTFSVSGLIAVLSMFTQLRLITSMSVPRSMPILLDLIGVALIGLGIWSIWDIIHNVVIVQS